jgi:glycosyltransferase involved in cell wall biosynthesis
VTGQAPGGDPGRPLRIFVAHPSALLTDHLPHGDGLIAWGFITGLAARGHEVHVAVQAVDLERAPGSEIHLHEVAPGAAGPLGRLRFMAAMRRCFERLQRQARFDVIHQLNPVDVGISLALADAPAPMVLGPYWPDFSTDQWDGPGPAAAQFKRVLRSAQQRRSTVTLLSTPAAAVKLSARRGNSIVREVWPGIDTAEWAPGPASSANRDVLFVAGLYPYKGISVLVDAFAQLGLDGARLVIGGSGPEEDAIRRRIGGSPGLAGVELAGELSRPAVKAAMQACAVYCLPSYGEPFGMGALEAMACAKPVVGTDAGGLRHLFTEEGGRHVPLGDVSALTRALREILTDRAAQRTMGAHNRRRVQELYAWPRVIDRLESVYREAIAAGGRA